jgi:branched-chain amino acid transport system substrate-binding protein
MSSKTLIAVALAGGLALAGCGSSSGGDTSSSDTGPIKIGMVAPLTGPFSPLGAGDKAAAEQEVKKINDAGGIGGRKIELTVKDDKSEVPQSVSLYNQFAADRTYNAVLSSANVSASTAIGPSAISTKTPTLTLGPVSVFADGSNPYAFTIPATPAVYAKKMVEYFSAQGMKTLSVAYSGKDVYGATGNEATKAAAQEAGIKIVLDEPVDPGATDFTPMITKVKAAKADAFLLWLAGPGPVIITKQLQGTGIKLYGTGANASNLYVQPAGKAAEGVVMSSSIAVPGSELPAGPLKTLVDDFAGPWQAANEGVYPPQFAFDGVTGIQLLKAAIEKAGSSDRQAIRDALEGLDVLTPTGRFTYSKTNHSGLTGDAVAVVTVKDGKLMATDFSLKQFATTLPK